MITRYLSSAGIGIAVTTALLWTMNALIDMGETVSTPRPPIDDVPELRPPTETTAAVIPVKVSKLPNAPSGPAFGAGLMGNPDSALINVMTAQPEYPMAALNKGLEGYVIVSFDVSELGTVENVEVVESSHSIFNKAAVKAAYRSKYRPKTVDGVSQRTQDLKKMIRFEIEN
jgi:protein TonB